MARTHWAGLVAVVGAFCALATLQSLATRLQWGPDEPAHIIYVRSLAQDSRFPALSHSVEDNLYAPGAARTHAAHHPPLYYALAALVWRAFADRPEEVVRYTDRDGVAHQLAVPGPVRPVRFLSVALGAATLALVWATARLVFPGQRAVWLGAVALVGFTPMFTYMSGVINNDGLMALVFTAAAWQWASIVRSGASWRHTLALGLLLGVALNVKETAVGLLAVSLAALAVEGERRPLGARLARVGAMLGLTAGVGGWWLLRRWVIHGQPLVYPFIYPLVELEPQARRALLAALPRCIFQFTFMPADVIAPRADLGLLTRFFGGLSVLALGGLALGLARRSRGGLGREEAASLGLWGLAVLIVLAGLLRNVLLVDWRMGTSGGRYLVATLPMLGLAGARGLSALGGDGRAGRALLAGVSLALLAVNVYAIRATALAYGTLGW